MATRCLRASLLACRLAQVPDKKANEVLQRFIWHTSDECFRETAKDKAQASAGEMTPNGCTAGRRALRILAQLLVTDSEAQNLVSDLTVIARDLSAEPGPIRKACSGAHH